MADHHPKAEKELVQEQEALLDDPDFLKEIVRRMLQQLLEIEMTEHIGAAPYQRTEDRKGQRNGYKPRTLKTRVGKLELLVPQDREGTFSTRLFVRYQRNEKALVLALMEMYIEGVSTRKVKEVTPKSCAAPPSQRAWSRAWPKTSTQSLSSSGASGRLRRRLIPTSLWTPVTRRLGCPRG